MNRARLFKRLAGIHRVMGKYFADMRLKKSMLTDPHNGHLDIIP